MKRLLLATLLATVLTPAAVSASISCGIKPITPIGCDYNSARCVCDSDGNCRWVFDC